mgnify:FL=1
MFLKRETTKTKDVERLLKIYEALRGSYEIKKLQKEIAFQEERGGIIWEEQGGDILAVAFTWHIQDPYDLVDSGWSYPGESPSGRYVYLPLLWIKESARSYGFLICFLRKCLSKHPGARRLAFRRVRPRDEKKIHILMRFNGHATSLRSSS